MTSVTSRKSARPVLIPVLGAAVLAALGVTAAVEAQQVNKMTFFVTSTGLGKGADLGGIAGADAHCAALAKAAGSTRTNWKAYLSSSPTAAPQGGVQGPGVNARDRIGKGPWTNIKGVVVARNLADLHSDKAKITQATALTEKGDVVPGRADVAGGKANTHDMLTGSDPQGMYSTGAGDQTCGNWTKSGEGSAIVGHHDREGLNPQRHMTSWNSSHGSRGCSAENLKSSGGAGQFYCFAAN